MSKPKVGMIGLGVMGASLARNMESRGYQVAVHNRDNKVLDRFMQDYGSGNFVPCRTIQEFAESTESPRQIFVMVTAGPAVDAVIDALAPHISKGDIIIDLGNSYFPDTIRREKRCKELGLNFIGVGVSGGEEGALKGPSIMPGGPREAWQIVAPLFEKIAAQADGPCTAYIGPDGAGHFVKMVHNGIEYGDMQLIAEAYDVLRNVIGAKPEELANIFADWNKGPLSSFLIEITSKIFTKKDDVGSGYLVDKILDRAEQKGTGKWTAQVALELGVSIPTITSALDARMISSMKSERVTASKELPGPNPQDFSGDRKEFIQMVHDALYCSKIMSYAQGMALMSAASKHYNWNLKLDELAAIWKGGCIIRAGFLDEIRKAYKNNPGLQNLILDPFMKSEVLRTMPNLRKVIQVAAEKGIPTYAFGASRSYFDSCRTADLPQNLTQAQRDFFGSHTYQRTDKEGTFHATWEK